MGFRVPAAASLQHLVEPPLRLAGEQRNAHRERFVQRFRPFRQHREAARDMEAADADRDPRRPQRTGDVQRARELIRLHADEADQSQAAVVFDLPRDSVRAGCVSLVSSTAKISMSTSSPSAAVCIASCAIPYRQASEFDGSADRNHWIT